MKESAGAFGLDRYPSLFWPEVVDENHLMAVKEAIDRLMLSGPKPKKIVLFISNMGGGLDEALLFYNWVKLMKIPLVTVAAGGVHSAAVLLLLAGQERFACANSWFFLHDLYLDVSQQVDVKNIHEISDELRICHNIYLRILSEATGTPQKKFATLSGRDSYFLPEKAKELGIVHAII